MFQGYMKCKCIEKMTDDYKARFNNIVREYAEILNENNTISDGGTVFTLHDFDHHCFNLYKIVSEIILDNETSYNFITDEELYILNLAILLHDIGMTEHIELTRSDHSRKSAERIREDYKNPLSPLSDKKSMLRKNDVEVLALIVQAHSDVKDGSVPQNKNGLNNPELTNHMSSATGHIRAKFLANILRFADELDITSDRLGNPQIIKEFKKAKFKKNIVEQKLRETTYENERKNLEIEMDRLTKAEESYRCWKFLELFKCLEREESGNVKIILDDSEISEIVDVGDSNYDELAKDIVEVTNKVQKEYEIFNKDIGEDMRLLNMVGIKSIEVYTNIGEIKDILIKVKKNEISPQVNDFKPKVISTDIENKVGKFIEKRNLYNTGHYLLHDDLCARDWIDIEEIVLTESFFKKCETQLLLHLQNEINLSDNSLFIGIDFYGMLIASRLSFILHKPYDYLIPYYRRSKSSSKEFDLECSIDGVDDVIIITDVIVTLDTVSKLAEDYGIKNKIKAIYAIMYREINGMADFEQNNIDLMKKSYVLNSNYPIEVRRNTNCKYKNCEEKCKANNKFYY